ncbi:hypothetical protein [Puia sp.]|uniref:hypothetical protein n=1 Tax=Puia sp. TaxID=2045100 RepID=UPI002F4052F1
MKKHIIKGSEENGMSGREVSKEPRSGWWSVMRGLLSSVPPFEKRKTFFEFFAKWTKKNKSSFEMKVTVRKE